MLILQYPETTCEEICSIPVGRNDLRIHVSSIWHGPCTTNIYKNNETTGGYSETPEHTSDNIFRHMFSDTALFLMEQLGFEINMEKSVFDPYHCREFLGMKIISKSMTIPITKRQP